MRTTARLARVAACVALVIVAAPALADVVFSHGWMRPARAGDPQADVYVDVTADDAQTITGAQTPIARKVDLVAGRVEGRDYTTQVVDRFALPAHATLRFARYGNVLRLHDIVADARVGETVHVTFTFRDAAGHEQRADADVVVRGLALPPPAKAPAPAATPPAG